MLLYLIRHGEAENNSNDLFPDDLSADYSLTQRGVEQVMTTAQQLKALNIDEVVSSPVRRARETAELIASTLGKGVRLDERLREAGLGSLRGKKWQEVVDRDPQWYMEYFGPWVKYGIEKYDSIRERMVSAVKENLHLGSVVMVSHLEPIRSVIGVALGLSGPQLRKVKIYNASISVLRVPDVEGSTWDLLAVNWLPINAYKRLRCGLYRKLIKRTTDLALQGVEEVKSAFKKRFVSVRQSVLREPGENSQPANKMHNATSGTATLSSM